MSNPIEGAENVGTQIGNFVGQHPWEAVAALAWPVPTAAYEVGKHLGKAIGDAVTGIGAGVTPGDPRGGSDGAGVGGGRDLPQGGVNAQGGGDRPDAPKDGAPKPQTDLHLTDREKETAQAIEKAILAGDLDGLKHDMHNYAGHAGDLTNVMRQVQRDLLPQGLVLTYNHGQTMRGDEHAFHDEGSLTLHGANGGHALEVNTAARDGACVGGPIKKMPDGSYQDGYLAFSGEDPAKFLKDLVKKEEPAPAQPKEELPPAKPNEA